MQAAEDSPKRARWEGSSWTLGILRKADPFAFASFCKRRSAAPAYQAGQGAKAPAHGLLTRIRSDTVRPA